MHIKQTRDTMSDIYFDALRIRNTVFVKEQGVPYELEMENPVEEAEAVHFVGYIDGTAVGTVRLLADSEGKTALVQRMAILKEERGKGYAHYLIDALLAFAKEAKLSELVLHAQVTARGLYDKFDFIAEGEVFEEAGIDHITMRKIL